MPPQDYASYIAAILGIPNVRVPVSKRIAIQTCSMPSIFHAEAWRYYQGLTTEYFFLTDLTIKLKGN
jgi:hypothetical protein